MCPGAEGLVAVQSKKHPMLRQPGPHRAVGMLPAAAEPCALLCCPVVNEPLAMQHGAGTGKLGV